MAKVYDGFLSTSKVAHVLGGKYVGVGDRLGCMVGRAESHERGYKRKQSKDEWLGANQTGWMVGVCVKHVRMWCRLFMSILVF